MMVIPNDSGEISRLFQPILKEIQSADSRLFWEEFQTLLLGIISQILQAIAKHSRQGFQIPTTRFYTFSTEILYILDGIHFEIIIDLISNVSDWRRQDGDFRCSSWKLQTLLKTISNFCYDDFIYFQRCFQTLTKEITPVSNRIYRNSC